MFHFNGFFKFFIFFHFQCLSRYIYDQNLTSITTPDWMGLWNRSPNFAAPNKLILGSNPHGPGKRKKTTSSERWLPRAVLQKSFSKTFTKFTEIYLLYSLFLILLKALMPSGLQLYCREILTLVFQNQPFVDPLQIRCS